MKQKLTTDYEVCALLKDLITPVVSAVELEGDVRLYNRRFQSRTEDIVIKPLVFDARQTQRGIFLINIHVPNLINQQGGGSGVDNTQPNLERMEEIAQAIYPVLETENTSLYKTGELTPDGQNWFYSIHVEVIFFRNDLI